VSFTRVRHFSCSSYSVMKRDPLTQAFDLATAQVGRRCDWVRVMALLLVTGSFLLQGCVAGASMALVAFDSTRSSQTTFRPFERSWVAQPDQSSDALHNSKVTSVAVLPVEGDPEMGARLVAILRQETMLRVEVPATVAAGVIVAYPRLVKADDTDFSTLATKVTRNLEVDAVLASRVAGSPAHASDWGCKAEGSRRLYLYLVDRDGHLLWKDELPFTLVKSFTTQTEESVQINLTHHIMQHIKELHLDELGYLPKKIS
jgi:hypothetical protein